MSILGQKKNTNILGEMQWTQGRKLVFELKEREGRRN